MPKYKQPADSDSSFEELLQEEEKETKLPLKRSKVYVPYVYRRNLILELDKTFMDLIDEHTYEIKFNSGLKSSIKFAFGKVHRIRHKLNDNTPFNIVVVFRKDFAAFLKTVKKRFNLFVVSYVNKDLMCKILDIVDP